MIGGGGGGGGGGGENLFDFQSKLSVKWDLSLKSYVQ